MAPLQPGMPMVRSIRDIEIPGTEVKEAELKLARQLIDQQTSEAFDPSAYTDEVGARIEIDHLGPTMVGQTIAVTAKVVELALPRVVFEVEVKDEIDTVGRSKHIRFVVDKAKQGERLKRKAEKVKAAKG